MVLWSTRKAELKLQMPQGQSREDSEDLIDVLRLCPGGNKWASEIFKQVSGMSRLVFRDVSGCRESCSLEPEARSEQIMCEVASAAQRGNYLKEANLLGCRRPRRSPKRNPAGLTNRTQNTVPVWSLEIRSDSWSYHQTAVHPWNNGSASLCLHGKRGSKALPCELLIKLQ